MPLDWTSRWLRRIKREMVSACRSGYSGFLGEREDSLSMRIYWIQVIEDDRFSIADTAELIKSLPSAGVGFVGVFDTGDEFKTLLMVNPRNRNEFALYNESLTVLESEQRLPLVEGDGWNVMQFVIHLLSHPERLAQIW